MKKAGKKVYEKPEIYRVELRVGEAVLGVCKTASTVVAITTTNCVAGGCLEEVGS